MILSAFARGSSATTPKPQDAWRTSFTKAPARWETHISWGAGLALRDELRTSSTNTSLGEVELISDTCSSRCGTQSALKTSFLGACELLASGASDSQIAEYFWSVVTEQMGLSAKVEDMSKTVAALRRIREVIFPHSTHSLLNSKKSTLRSDNASYACARRRSRLPRQRLRRQRRVLRRSRF